MCIVEADRSRAEPRGRGHWSAGSAATAGGSPVETRTTAEPDTVFEMELEEPCEGAAKVSSRLDGETSRVLEHLAAPEDSFAKQLQADVLQIQSNWKVLDKMSSVTIVDMGMELRLRRYKVHVRAGLGLKKRDLFSPGNGFKPVSNTNPECLEVFRHKFLMVGQVVTGIRGRAICSREIVVQPDFRSHFVLPVMTERYKNVLKLLPNVFVGGRSQLRNLLGLVCGEMEENFKGHQREVPPWRLLKATLTKWCPKRYEVFDIVMNASHPMLKQRLTEVKKLDLKSLIHTGQHAEPIAMSSVSNAQMNSLSTALAA